MANTSIGENIATTHRKWRKQFADNILNHNALLRRLNEKGRVQEVDGGRTLDEELLYPGGSNFQWYSGSQPFNMTPQPVISAAEYDPKQAASTIQINGFEMRINRGSAKKMSLIDGRRQAATKDMQNNISTGVYSNGTGSGGKEIGGLRHLVADDPATGTVGGIVRGDFSYWRNSTSGDLASPAATNIQGFMNARWLTLVRGADHPDLIVADGNFFTYYWESLVTIQRITTPTKGESGFRSLEYNGPGGSAPVMYDDACPANHMYMLNTDYLHWRPYEGANMEALDQLRSFNQDAVMVAIIFMGNLTMSNASLQGVLWT